MKTLLLIDNQDITREGMKTAHPINQGENSLIL